MANPSDVALLDKKEKKKAKKEKGGTARGERVLVSDCRTPNSSLAPADPLRLKGHHQEARSQASNLLAPVVCFLALISLARLSIVPFGLLASMLPPLVDPWLPLNYTRIRAAPDDEQPGPEADDPPRDEPAAPRVARHPGRHVHSVSRRSR